MTENYLNNTFCRITSHDYKMAEVWDIKEASDGNRVLTKGQSPAKVLRGFNTNNGHKARKRFWI